VGEIVDIAQELIRQRPVEPEAFADFGDRFRRRRRACRNVTTITPIRVGMTVASRLRITMFDLPAAAPRFPGLVEWIWHSLPTRPRIPKRMSNPKLH
jgi:hypothetical protein